MISLSKLKQEKRNQAQGFTIVELLIVIVVIGILALLVITTYGGIQQKTRNAQRTADIKAVATQIEAYYADNQHYPSLTDMKSDAWLGTNMKSLDLEALVDPSNATQSNDMVTTPAAKVYAYDVQNDAGTSCESDSTTCTKYTLTGTYEGEVNGKTTTVKKNQDGS